MNIQHIFGCAAYFFRHIRCGIVLQPGTERWDHCLSCLLGVTAYYYYYYSVGGDLVSIKCDMWYDVVANLSGVTDNCMISLFFQLVGPREYEK